jgi:hypothetical protein
MMTRPYAVLAILMGVLLAGPANAGLITFDFTGGGPNGISIEQTLGDVKLSVTADKTHSGNGPFTVTSNKNGLGVSGAPDSGRIGADEILFQNVREELIFTLKALTGAPSFELVAVDLFDFDAGDRLRLFVDGTKVGKNLKPRHTTNGNWTVSNTITGPYSLTATSSFGLRAQNVNGGDGFRIASLTIRVPEAATVPEPATLALVGPALAGLAFRRRRPGRLGAKRT